jgi:uncharacterized protein
MDDALRPAPDASYDAQAASPPLDAREAAVAERMIGRPLRGLSAAAVRCGWGLPAVLRVGPRLADGTPFPTTWWLACPLAVRHVGRLEADGAMRELNRRLGDEPGLARAYEASHRRYVAARNALGGPLPGDPGVGGMPGRVKCLHSLYAHHLTTRDNPLGAWVGEQVEPMACPAPCVDVGEPVAGGDREGGTAAARGRA